MLRPAVFAAWLFALLAPGPAAALSCLAPDPERAFADANAAPDAYWIVVGHFSGGPGPRPEGDSGDRRYQVTFRGHNVNRGGRADALALPVIVEERCIGPWCPSFRTNREVLTFLRLDPAGPAVLAVDACGSNLFYDPTPAQMQAIRHCFAVGCTAG